jgi:hypothetical protein
LPFHLDQLLEHKLLLEKELRHSPRQIRNIDLKTLDSRLSQIQIPRLKKALPLRDQMSGERHPLAKLDFAP